jgi:hypothetical protein
MSSESVSSLARFVNRDISNAFQCLKLSVENGSPQGQFAFACMAEHRIAPFLSDDRSHYGPIVWTMLWSFPRSIRGLWMMRADREKNSSWFHCCGWVFQERS